MLHYYSSYFKCHIITDHCGDVFYGCIFVLDFELSDGSQLRDGLEINLQLATEKENWSKTIS